MARSLDGPPRSYELLTHMRRSIASGELGAGTQIPAERNLATMHDVSRSTVRRVLAQLEKEGLIERRHGSGTYVGFMSAAASATTNAVCVLVPDAGPALTFGLFRGVEELAAREGFRVVLSHHDSTPEKERLIEGMAGGTEVKGFVIFGFGGGFIKRFCARLIEERTPFVTVDNPIEGVPSDLVSTDNHAAAFEGTSVLIEAGHTVIGYVGRYRDAFTSRERLRGYLDALKEHGIERRDRLVKVFTDSPGDVEAGEAVARLAERERVTAVFVATEPFLPHVMRALRKSGRPGSGLPVIASMDDAYRQGVDGAAVLVRQPLHWLGVEAARLVFDRIKERQGRYGNGARSPLRTVLVRPEIKTTGVAVSPA